MSWDAFIAAVLVGVAAVITAVALLIKVMGISYGKIIETQNGQIGYLQRQINSLVQSRSKERRLRIRDRKRCKNEIETLIGEISQMRRVCPVLAGETDCNVLGCPMNRKEDMAKTPEPKEKKANDH